MRVVAGTARGIPLVSPGTDLRPTMEVVKNAIGHPNRKRPSYHDWACRRHIARYDSAATCEALGWKPAGTREAIIEKGIVAAVRRYMR